MRDSSARRWLYGSVAAVLLAAVGAPALQAGEPDPKAPPAAARRRPGPRQPEASDYTPISGGQHGTRPPRSGGRNRPPDYTPISVVPQPGRGARGRGVFRTGRSRASIVVDVWVPTNAWPADPSALKAEVRELQSLQQTGPYRLQLVAPPPGLFRVGGIATVAGRHGRFTLTVGPVPPGQREVYCLALVVRPKRPAGRRVYGCGFVVVDTR